MNGESNLREKYTGRFKISGAMTTIFVFSLQDQASEL
jgi:hypothetical protein